MHSHPYIVNITGAPPLAPAHKHTCCLARGDRASAFTTKRTTRHSATREAARCLRACVFDDDDKMTLREFCFSFVHGEVCGHGCSVDHHSGCRCVASPRCCQAFIWANAPWKPFPVTKTSQPAVSGAAELIARCHEPRHPCIQCISIALLAVPTSGRVSRVCIVYFQWPITPQVINSLTAAVTVAVAAAVTVAVAVAVVVNRARTPTSTPPPPRISVLRCCC